MNVRRELAALTLLSVFLAVLACKNNDLYEPEHAASDRGARSALSDTVSVVEKPNEPVEEEENNILSPDTASVSGKPQELIVSIADEKFLIKAEVPDSLKETGIFLTFISEQNLGCRDSYFSIQHSWKENSPFEIRIGDLALSGECVQKTEKVTGMLFLYRVPEGENILRIHIGEKSFEGKIIRHNSGYIFEWPDESQFKFSDKVLNF